MVMTLPMVIVMALTATVIGIMAAKQINENVINYPENTLLDDYYLTIMELHTTSFITRFVYYFTHMYLILQVIAQQ